MSLPGFISPTKVKSAASKLKPKKYFNKPKQPPRKLSKDSKMVYSKEDANFLPKIFIKMAIPKKKNKKEKKGPDFEMPPKFTLV